MGMKLKKIIKEIENNDESTITVDKANYIALLREVNRLRFKCSQRGALSRSKKMSSKDNGDEHEAVLGWGVKQSIYAITVLCRVRRKRF